MNRDFQLEDQDAGKGAVEQDRPGQQTNESMSGQSGHRDQDAMLKTSDSDFPEKGQNEEHTGESRGGNQLEEDGGCNPEGTRQEQDQGHRQKQDQNKSTDDPLAA